MKEQYDMKFNELDGKCNKTLILNQNQSKEIEKMKEYQKKEIEGMKEHYDMRINELEEKLSKALITNQNQKKEIEQIKKQYLMKINELEEKCNKALIINQKQKKEIEQIKENYEKKINEIEEISQQKNRIMGEIRKEGYKAEYADDIDNRIRRKNKEFGRNSKQTMPTINHSKSLNEFITKEKRLSETKNNDQSISLISFDSLDQDKTKLTDFVCHINETSLIKCIKIDTQISKTSSDIKKQIAHKLNLNAYQFTIDFKQKDNSIIYLSILKPFSNIKFQFPTFSCVINDCYEKSFNEVIFQFNKQNIFFSNSLIDLIQFKLWDITIPKSDFYFNCISEGTPIYVEPANIVTLKCNYLTFNFIENETVSSAVNLIQCLYKEYKIYVQIKLCQCNKELNGSDILKCENQYFVQILKKFTFVKKNGNSFDKYLFFLMTVSEVKALFAKSFSIAGELKPDDIIIFGNNNNISCDHYRLTDSITYNNMLDKDVICFDIQYQSK